MIRIDSLWLAVEPMEMRAGANRLLASVVQVFGSSQAHHGYQTSLVTDALRKAWFSKRQKLTNEFHFEGLCWRLVETSSLMAYR